MEKLESLLDNILGAKMAKLFGGPNVSLLERMEVKLGQVLDRHFPDKVEAFHEMVALTKSPLIKGKNMEVFAKGIMPALQVAAAKAGKEGGGGAGAKRAAPGGGGGGGKKARTSVGGGSKGKKGGGGAGASKAKVTPAAAAAHSNSGDDDVSSLGDISMDEEDGALPSSSASAGMGGGGGKSGAALVEDPEAILADSDGKLRGELHLVERCPALVYKSWRDVDHDVYVFGLPQLAAAKRKLADGGVIALFLGYGQYRDFTAKGFRATAMKPPAPSADATEGAPTAATVRTCDRPWEEVFAFLEKGAAMRGAKGEAARRKAYVAAVQFFQRHVYSLPVTEEDPFPSLPRKLAPKQAKAAAKKKAAARKAQPRAALPAPAAVAPIAAAAPVAAGAGGAGGAPVAAAAPTEALAAAVPAAAAAAAAPGAAGGEAAVEGPGVWATMPDAADKSIRGLFASLRWRLERLEAVCGANDPFVWSLNTAQGNIDNICDELFADGGDPEAEDRKRMLGSICDKTRRKVEEKVRAQPPNQLPAAAVGHGQAVLGLYAELKGAVQRFQEGDEAEVEGWDSLEFTPGPQAQEMAAAAAKKEGEEKKEGKEGAAAPMEMDEPEKEDGEEAAAPAPLAEDRPEEEASAVVGLGEGEKEGEEKEGEKEGSSVAAEEPGGSSGSAAAQEEEEGAGAQAKEEEEGEEEEDEGMEQQEEEPAAEEAAPAPPSAPPSPARPPLPTGLVAAENGGERSSGDNGGLPKLSQPQEDAAAALLGLVGGSPSPMK